MVQGERVGRVEGKTTNMRMVQIVHMHLSID